MMRRTVKGLSASNYFSPEGSGQTGPGKKGLQVITSSLKGLQPFGKPYPAVSWRKKRLGTLSYLLMNGCTLKGECYQVQTC